MRETDEKPEDAAKTREETLARLALDASKGAGAAKRFTALVRRVIKTPKTEIDARAKEWKEARKAASSES
jgi:hypothetical protein